VVTCNSVILQGFVNIKHKTSQLLHCSYSVEFKVVMFCKSVLHIL